MNMLCEPGSERADRVALVADNFVCRTKNSFKFVAKTRSSTACRCRETGDFAEIRHICFRQLFDKQIRRIRRHAAGVSRQDPKKTADHPDAVAASVLLLVAHATPGDRG